MQYLCFRCCRLILASIAALTLVTCASLPATPATHQSSPSPLTTLYRFKGGDANVTGTVGPGMLVQGADGSIYGIGYQWKGRGAHPTLFRMDLAGNISAIVRLKATPLSMIQGIDSNFYITSVNAVIKITPQGVVSVLHTFTGSSGFHVTDTESNTLDASSDGALPSGSLVQGNDGALYGVTKRGGIYGRGIAFKITTDGGNFTKLCDFYGDEFKGVQQPEGPLVIGKDGTLYGRAHTRFGSDFDGVIFSLAPSGTISVLRAFDQEEGCADCLILARDGNLYGMVARYHTYPADRAFPVTYSPHLFRLTTSGVYSRFRTYREQCLTFGETETDSDHFFDAGLQIFQGPDLNFYGYSSRDVLFQVTPKGKETPMYVFRHDLNNADFTGDFNVTVSIITAPEGYWPNSLILARDGYLYGATTCGGSTMDDSQDTGRGTIFRLNYAPKPISHSDVTVRPTTASKSVRPAAHKRKSKLKKPS